MKTLNRKLVRDMRGTWGQVVAVMAVILCGTASFASVMSCFKNLTLTRDSYYREYRMADFWIPMERAPKTAVWKVAAIPGVSRVQGRIVKDVNVDIAGVSKPRLGRVISMPDRPGTTTLNGLHLVKGRYFSQQSDLEVILSDRFARANGLAVGDTIRAAMNNKKYALRIVGLGLSPEYVYVIRNTQEILPSPERFGILWVKESLAETAFDMQEACNEIVGTVSEGDLPDILDRAETILKPYGVFTTIERKNQLSNRYVSDEIAGLKVSATVTPAIFLGLASLILMIMLSRMVRRQRTEIGVLKAYGYSNWALATHYVKFALVVSLVGSTLGFVVAQWLSREMLLMYVKYFHFPVLKYRLYGSLLLQMLGISAAFGIAGALTAVAGVIRIQPSETMRPEAPRSGQAILLERWRWFWRHARFTWKVILRNVCRYKVRAGLTVFGVMISTGILMVGGFSNDCMTFLMDFQFKEVQRYDVKVAFATERGKGAWYETMRLPHVRLAEPVLDYPFKLINGWRSKDMLITGLPRHCRLQRLLDMEGRPIDIGPEGLVLTDKAARDLGVGVGDRLILEPLMGKITGQREVRVTQIVQQYLGMGAYMNIEALSRMLEQSLTVNGVLLKIDAGQERALNESLKDVPGIGAVAIKADLRKAFESTIAESMGIMNAMIAIFAGVIAFAIIYNSTAISVNERSRELATLRVLGFSLKEVGRIIFNENIMLSLLGLLVGIPFGVLLCAWMVTAFDTELYRFPLYISAVSYVKTVVMVLLFVLAANWISRRRIRRLDMVEVLKARE